VRRRLERRRRCRGCGGHHQPDDIDDDTAHDVDVDDHIDHIDDVDDHIDDNDNHGPRDAAEP
jgi:hypothetical protein